MATTELLPPPGEFKTTEEIRDAKYAADLRRKRKRLLLWSAPLMLVALLAALKLLSAVAVNMAGTSAYENANHNTAADRFALLGDFFNVVEPWKAHFNEGTAIYAGGDFFGAKEELVVALDLVPRSPQGEPPGKEECDVRTNLSLSYEGMGDEAMAAGDPAMGANYYDQAQTALSNCGESGGSGGEEAQEAEERQEQSQSDAEQQQEEQQVGQEGESESPSEGESEGESQSPSDGESSGQSESPSDGESSGGESESPSEGESGEESASPTESSDPQQEELESRNDEAQQSADAEEQASGGGNGSGQNW
jgi:hypothetical protein